MGGERRACAEAFANNDAAFASWMATHPWVLERYREARARRARRAPFPY
jgi:hypothetical protein